MSFETALRARIKADPVVMAAGASVEWVTRPQGPFTAAIVLTIVSDPRDRTMGGRQGWVPTHIYIDVMAADAPTKAALREAVLALIGFGALRDDTRFWPAREIVVIDRSEQDETMFIHHDQIDAIIPNRQEA